MNPFLPTLKFTELELEALYPPREVGVVTRFCPSPTGFLHIGGLYAALISERFAHQSGGVFFVRIEDTDKKREVAGAAELIFQYLAKYGIRVDEGPGIYAPYTQSERSDIYAVYVSQLLSQGMAYLCFCSTQELEEIRQTQEQQKVRPGYWGKWALWRDRPEEDVQQALAEGKPYVIRVRSTGDIQQRIMVEDAVKGSLELPENDQDIVIMKSDGLPTYHLAHVVDDHLMRTTHVLRGDEWLSSLSLHLQLFTQLGFKPPIYGHISPIQKMDGLSKRKLSKRKDLEASISFYDEQGYPVKAVEEYMLTLANSSFEDWRSTHLTEDSRRFELSLAQISKSGALFDFTKLASLSQEVIAQLTAEEVYDQALSWANRFDVTLAAALQKDKKYSVSVFAIERGNEQARKDISKWSDISPEFGFFFENLFAQKAATIQELLASSQKEDAGVILANFLKVYDPVDSKEVWFEKLQLLVVSYGYALSVKAYKLDPESYKGHVGDIAKVLRICLTGSTHSPDLSQIMRVMGAALVANRLHSALD